MYQNIPDELKLYPQWVVWRYEESEGGKPTKVPYSPRTHRHADVNDPSTWATYEEAVSAVMNFNMYAGIGFMLSFNDPFAFIDLDDPYELKADGTYKHQNPDEVFQKQLKIYNAFESYSEWSPSGTGIHIIVKGSIECGRKRASVEIYSAQRFMTMTGNYYRGMQIQDHHEMLNGLWRQMSEGQNAGAFYSGLDHAKWSDAQVIEMAATAANGQKFCDLFYDGDWGKYYPSQSEADLALIDIIAFYSENRFQVQNLFLQSKLGQREKSRAQYRINYMLAKCFDRMLPPVDIDGLRDQIRAAIDRKAIEDSQRHRNEAIAPEIESGQTPLPQNAQSVYSAPPGLIGELAQFIYAQAPRPVPEIALAGAIGLVAGIVGRSYNISGTGLNQYVLLLAPTGTGKEAIAKGIDKLMTAVANLVPASKEFLGPGEISSPQALSKYLARESASFVSLMGEFGLMLRQMSAWNASPHLVGLRRMLLDLFNKSGEGNKLRPTIYSDREKNTSIVHAPSVTLLGESTPERFYDVLNEDMITEGLLPRFTIIEYYGQRPDFNENHNKVEPSINVIERLAEICAHSLNLNQHGRAVHVLMDDETTKMMKQFDKHCDERHRSSERDIKRQLWSRAHVKVLKLAAIIAVGCNPYDPTITMNVATWAINIVLHDVNNMINRFEAGEVGQDNEEQKQLNEVIRVTRDYMLLDWEECRKYSTGSEELHREKIIPFSYLSRRLISCKAFKMDRRGASKAIEITVKHLVDRGDMQELSRATLVKQYDTTAKCFMISSPKAFNL